MNFLTVVALFTIVAATEAGKEQVMASFKNIAVECALETGAKKGDIGLMMKHLPATNMEIKCLRACIMKRIEVMTPDGKFNKNAAMKMAETHTHGDPEKMKIADLVTSACASIPVPDNHCEAAELYKMCLQNEAMQRGIKLAD